MSVVVGQVALGRQHEADPECHPQRGAPKAAVTPCQERLTLAASITPAANALDAPSTVLPAERTKINGNAPKPVANAVTGSKEDRDDSRLHLPSLCPLAGRSRVGVPSASLRRDTGRGASNPTDAVTSHRLQSRPCSSGAFFTYIEKAGGDIRRLSKVAATAGFIISQLRRG